MSNDQNTVIKENWTEYRFDWLSLRKLSETDLKEDEHGEYVENEVHQAIQEAGEIKEDVFMEREYLPFAVTKKGLEENMTYEE